MNINEVYTNIIPRTDVLLNFKLQSIVTRWSIEFENRNYSSFKFNHSSNSLLSANLK